MKYYQLTEYPNIYINTYWGAFEDTNGLIDDDIILNRNNFIKDFNIKNKPKLSAWCSRFLNTLPKQFLDHPEIYRDREKNFVFVTSPYCWNEEPPKPFREVGKMYTTNSRTFVCVLSLQEVKFYVNGYK